jgi:hypothetical protein
MKKTDVVYLSRRQEVMIADIFELANWYMERVPLKTFRNPPGKKGKADRVDFVLPFEKYHPNDFLVDLTCLCPEKKRPAFKKKVDDFLCLNKELYIRYDEDDTEDYG